MKMITWDEGIYTSYNKLLHLGIYNYFLYNWNVLIYNKETAYRRVQDIEEQYENIVNRKEKCVRKSVHVVSH